MNNFFQKTKRGFTLVELLIVIVIIAVLAGIVLVVIDPAKQRARAQATTQKSNVGAVCRAQAVCLVEAATAADCNEFGTATSGNPGIQITAPVGVTIATSGPTVGLITGVVTAGDTDFTFTCTNAGATKGSVTCAPLTVGTGSYMCSDFNL